MKKFLSLILALLMTVSCASVAFANEDAALDGADTAVEETPYDDAMQYLYAVGIFKGYTEDGQMLGAADPIQRYQMALLAARIATGWIGDDTWLNGSANDTEFTDLEGDVQDKYLGAISYASQMGLIEGYGDGTFKPYDNITYRDVLTIACRLIGYKNLKYPWGFIEKAVNLGLTEGIEDVAYTEVLTRGGVAQVLYNALFTKVNNTTLAAELFGIELSWADIMVTANDKYVLAGVDATAKSGKVAIQVVNGSDLDKNVLYVDNTKLDTEGQPLTVGQFYRALFSQDVNDKGNSTLVKAEPYGVVGSADNTGLNADGNLVDNVGNTAAGTLLTGNSFATFEFVGNKEKYAYDYSSGHIYNVKWENGKASLNGIKWYYSRDLDLYFECIVTDADNPTVIYRPVDEADVMDLLENWFHNDSKQGGVSKFSSITKTAYSHVDVVNAPNDKKVSYYEAYELGIFSKGENKCNEHTSAINHTCTKDKKAVTYTFAPVVLVAGEGDTPDFKGTYCAGCDDCNGYTLVADETPDNGSYVIYGVNHVTKEIKIIEVIDEYDAGDDSYIAKGIVRGFRMSQNYVIIGDQKFEYNYDLLKGNAISVDYNDEDTKVSTIDAYSKYFANLVNNYVEYLVVDGKLVWIKNINESGDNYIIVENVVGFSSDGYPVIGGYSTANGKLHYDTFKIAGYDQWKFGDMYFYPTNTALKNFVRGSIYEITSYDEEEEAYFVKTIWSVLDNTDLPSGSKTMEFDSRDVERWEDGYIKVDGSLTKNTSKKYVVVDADLNTGDADKPIHVFEGTLPVGWYVKGDAFVDDSTTIIVNAETNIKGFDENAYDFSLAVVLDKIIVDMVYDGADTPENKWFIEGAMEYKIEVFDLYKGEFREVYAGYNLNLVNNHIYAVIDDYIVRDDEIAWEDLEKYYTDNDIMSATYVIEDSRVDEITYADLIAKYDDNGNKADDGDFTYFDKFISEGLDLNKVYDEVKESDDAKTYYYVDFLDAADRYGKHHEVNITKFTGLAEGILPESVAVTVIYDGDDFLVYIYEGGHKHTYEETSETRIASTKTVTDDDTTTIDVKTGLNVGTIEGKIVAEIAWTGTHTETTTETKWVCDCGHEKWLPNKPVTAEAWNDVTVESVTFKFVGLDEVEHAIVADKGYYFTVDKHADNVYDASFTTTKAADAGKTTIASDLFAGDYECIEGCHEDVAVDCHVFGCDLVKALVYAGIDLALDGDSSDDAAKKRDVIEFVFEQSETDDQNNVTITNKLRANIKVEFDATKGLTASVEGTPNFEAPSISIECTSEFFV